MRSPWPSPPAGRTFVVFDRQDSGCTTWGVEVDGRRWAVKQATTSAGRASLRRGIELHAHVRHPAIVAPVEVHDDGASTVWTRSPWREGVTLNAATVDGSDRRGLHRFRQLPLAVVLAGVDRVLDAHLAVAAAGFVAVDLYDGCFHLESATGELWLLDLDEYRPGPFTVEGDRLPGSTTYLAPEELRHGATIDERTTVFGLGRTIQQLLAGPDGWRGTADQAAVAARATDASPEARHPSVAALIATWRSARSPAS